MGSRRAQRRAPAWGAFLALSVAAPLPTAAAQEPSPGMGGDAASLVGRETSVLRDLVERYSDDRAALGRRWTVPYSEARRERFRRFYEGWAASMEGLLYDGLGLEGQVDYQLMVNELRYRRTLLDREEKLAGEMREFLPFTSTIVDLEERRRAREPVESEHAAELLAEMPGRIEQVREALEARREAVAEGDAGAEDLSKIVALRAVTALDGLTQRFKGWYEHYAGYDPIFTWWNEEPYTGAQAALKEYAKFLREEIVGARPGEDEPIVGDPIGADGMADDLRYEMIVYSPEELIAIAEREFAWGEARMLEASRDLGYGDDWKAALEHVKTLHRDPGSQTQLVRELADEAVAFIEEHDLVTVPPLANEIWRIEMMSPERQKVAPFFLGGETIQVAFPTDEMGHDDKLMSMRGNNEHFSRATVHHELIPGHHLQGFMTSRYNSHRRAFSTPFWGEGWALYMEMLLWDLDFPQSPEDRIGMLFWRMHRAARIIFSLSFHLERMSPQEAIDFLVDRVGHERANAEAEVRRSFNGSYSPLYQIAYMIGGLQIRALHADLVESGRMTNREFHDAILKGGRMPIEMVRARLLGEAPPLDFAPSWRFYGDPLDREVADPGEVPAVSRVRVETSEGAFVLAVHRDWSPIGADRFLELVESGYYDDARFHRVVADFIVQWGLAGDPELTARWQNEYIEDDPVVSSNTRGRIAYAFTDPGTRATQIYINLVDNVRLDSAGFAPFGEVVEGMDVVDRLYSGYGETSGGGVRRGDQSRIVAEGNEYLDREFPSLDRIIRARRGRRE